MSRDRGVFDSVMKGGVCYHTNGFVSGTGKKFELFEQPRATLGKQAFINVIVISPLGVWVQSEKFLR